jgi:DNA-binding NtrC family response regulator
MSVPRVLLVDDEPAIRFAMRDFLEAHGLAIDEAADCQSAIAAFRTARADVTVIDYLLPDGSGLELLARLRAIEPDASVVLLTAHASIDLAVRAIKEGAEQFLTKPIELPALQVVIQRVLEAQRSRHKVAASAAKVRHEIDPFLGNSDVIRRFADEIDRVRGADRPILLRGETGSGKGLLARWLHDHGPRAAEPFVDVNTAGLAREFFESELFGHEKGAFTGATGAKPGLLELAHRGTVFLDEIGDVDLQVQPKLLKVLEEKRFRRLGDVRDRQVDVRLLTATHQDLEALIDAKRFRQDLYFRISTIPLLVPPLRERRNDIPLLAADLLARFSRELGRPQPELAPDALEALERHHWPGNFRELRNVLERAALLVGSSVLHAPDLCITAPRARRGGFDSSVTLAELEGQYIEQVLGEENGHVENAARRLGVPRSTLYKKLKDLGLSKSETDPSRP